LDPSIKEKGKSKYYSQPEYKLRQKVLTFLFFLMLAFVFWLLNALDHNYSTGINFPIKYRHLYSDKRMVGDVPKQINLHVSGRGYTLLKNIFTARKHSIILSATSLSYISLDSDTNHFYVLTRNLKEGIQSQLGAELTLNYITPDTLYYEFSAIVGKKVPVELSLDLDFSTQYMLGGDPVVRPDCVTVSGPHSIVDTIYKVQTMYRKFTKVDKTFSTELRLKPFKEKEVSPSHKVVSVTIPVDKFTESFVMVPIKIINLPDSMQMKTFPTSIRINYIVALRNFNKVNPSQFRAIVDYKNISATINNKLKVLLKGNQLL
jgi:YbbR domain-containing protein